MNPEYGIGTQLGADGVKNVVATVEQYSAHESRRIQLENHAPIVMLRAQGSYLADEERSLLERLRNAPPPGDIRRHRAKQILALAITVILTGSGFFLAVLTFAPYRLGWQSYVFALGVATVVPYLVEELLDHFAWEPVLKALIAIAASAGIASLMLLADVRGSLLAQEIQSTPTVIFDDAAPEQAPQNDFYDKTLNPLRLATILLAFAMELGAGLALHKALTPTPRSEEDWQRLRRELAGVRQQMILAAGKITALEDEPTKFEAQLWRDFYKSMLTQAIQGAARKLLLVVLAMAFVSHAHAAGTAHHTNLVIAIDLSRSVNVKGPDGTTEFQKNVDGVTRVLAKVSSGTHVTIIGITDRSFAQPFILLSATVPDDAGYFGERLDQARQTLSKEWKQRSAKVAPTFSGTDIFGVLKLAGQIFDEQPSGDESRVLVMFSDMRNHTRELDLEIREGVPALRSLPKASYVVPVKFLRAQVYILGVDDAGESTAHWEALEQFWRGFFTESGAILKVFSVLRELSATSISGYPVVTPN